MVAQRVVVAVGVQSKRHRPEDNDDNDMGLLECSFLSMIWSVFALPDWRCSHDHGMRPPWPPSFLAGNRAREGRYLGWGFRQPGVVLG